MISTSPSDLHIANIISRSLFYHSLTVKTHTLSLSYAHMVRSDMCAHTLCLCLSPFIPSTCVYHTHTHICVVTSLTYVCLCRGSAFLTDMYTEIFLLYVCTCVDMPLNTQRSPPHQRKRSFSHSFSLFSLLSLSFSRIMEGERVGEEGGR